MSSYSLLQPCRLFYRSNHPISYPPVSITQGVELQARAGALVDEFYGEVGRSKCSNQPMFTCVGCIEDPSTFTHLRLLISSRGFNLRGVYAH
jgi:hypothetical protein